MAQRKRTSTQFAKTTNIGLMHYEKLEGRKDYGKKIDHLVKLNPKKTVEVKAIFKSEQKNISTRSKRTRGIWTKQLCNHEMVRFNTMLDV